MNKYLEKIAALSEESKQALRTTAAVQAAGIPAHLVGTAAGAGIYNRLGLGQKLSNAATTLSKSRIKPLALLGRATAPVLRSDAAGGFLGAAATGIAADYAAIRHSLHSGNKHEH